VPVKNYPSSSDKQHAVLTLGSLGEVLHTAVPVWLSGIALVSIEVVTQHQSRLVPRWVTVFGRVNHFGARPGMHPGLLSLPSVDRQNCVPSESWGK